MDKRLLFWYGIFLCVPINVYAPLKNEKNNVQYPPIIINNYIGMSNKNRTTNDPRFVSYNHNNMVQQQKTAQSTANNMFMKNGLDTILGNPHKFCSILRNHKDTIFFYTAVGTYLTLFIYLLSANHFLNRSDLWASWRYDTPIEQLYSFSQQELAQDLLRDIQRKHINNREPTNFVSPLLGFVQATQKEQKKIHRYLSIGRWISRLHLTFFFPINASKIAFAQERRTRLAFVKHIFLSWASEYNVQQVGIGKKRTRKVFKKI